jgi:hypothetical protein
MINDITVCIATIPPRAKLLRRALASVAEQTLQPAAIVVEYDHDRTGAAATKNRAAAKATTPWLAFLDDDDQFLPQHLLTLRNAADQELPSATWTGATDPVDVVYSIPYCPQLPAGRDPNGRYGVPFSATELRRRSYIQTTSLIRTDNFRNAGGFQLPDQTMPDGSPCPYDDWGLWLAMLDKAARFLHVPEVTFIWNHWGGNTSGLPTRW